MKRILLIAALCLLAACAKQPEPFTPVADEGVLVGNIVIPKTVEAVAAGMVTFKTFGETRLATGDKVTLTSADGVSSELFLTTNDRELLFILPETMLSGHYRISFSHAGKSYPAGSLLLNILAGEEKPVPVTAAEGATVYGLVECEGKGIPGVAVSDGYEVVVTDEHGVYQLHSEKLWKYVFITLPSGYEAPLQGIIPQFYAYLTEGPGVAERRDFSLKRVANDHFTMFFLGDIHMAKRADDINQFRRFARYMNKSLAEAQGRCYVMTLGDMTWDGYWYSNNFYFPEYLAEVSTWFSGVPFFHTMGNHDNDMNRIGDIEKTRPFTEFIGPSYYSFNIGKVHFVVTDDIDYNDVGTGSALRGNYKHNFSSNVVAWLAKDLALVDPETPVVISAHSPTVAPSGATTFKPRLTGADAPGEANTEDFLEAVKGHPVHFVAGHSHKVFHYEDKADQGYLEHNLGSVCGNWWNSGYVETGIHLCPDGAPGGYAIWEFTGTELRHRYQAAGMPEDYVFRAYDMGEVKKVITMEAADNEPAFQTYVNEFARFDDNDLLLNVWYWDSAWKIEVTADGKPLSMVREYTYDPLLTCALTMNYFARHASLTSSVIKPSKWPHFFRFRMPAAPAEICVKVTDRNGAVSTETFRHPKPFTLNEYRIAN